MNYYGKIEETDTLIGNMGLGVDYYKGEKGEQGIPGKDGKTPVKGVDYFTDAEIQQIENNAAAKIDLSDYAKSADLSTVATSGSYEDLTNKPTIPAAYELPTASATTLGGVKVGSGLDITNGVLSATGGGAADSIDWSKVQNKPNFADVATSGDYNDLSNKPTIPSVEGLASEAYVNEKVAAIKVPSLDGYAKTADLSTVATSGSYTDLVDKPTIPSVEGLASEAYVNEKVAAIVIPEVPTKVSELENDKGYLTEHQSLEGYAKTADLAQVAKTGSYNDLADKPSIPSTTGLASTEYVDSKVGEIVIPTVPTKVSAFENDSKYVTEGYLITNYLDVNQVEVNEENNVYLIIGKDIAATYDTENNEITTTYAKKTEIPAPYTLPTASTSTLGGVKVDGNTITITDGVISSVGSAEPDAYIKDASVSGNTLTLTKKDNTNVVFTPSGGSSGGGGYAFTSSQTFTDEDKIHLKEVYLNKNIHMTIDGLTVIRIFSMGSKMAYVVINTNGATSNQVFIYTVNRDSSGNITSDKFTLFMSYYLVGNSSALSLDWQATSNASESNLYNATEMVLYWTDNDGLKNQTYLNFTANLNLEVGQTLGTGWVEQSISIDVNREIIFMYDGSSINLYNSKSLDFILYKT